jgi:hypothetical protein
MIARILSIRKQWSLHGETRHETILTEVMSNRLSRREDQYIARVIKTTDDKECTNTAKKFGLKL